jgi:hypothetical protein
MKKTKYNFWLAMCYEIIKAVVEHFPSLKTNKIVKLILNYCKHDWILWRIESALDSVDKQVEALHKEWGKQEKPTREYYELPPDGSKAQQLLGGEMGIRSTYKQD